MLILALALLALTQAEPQGSGLTDAYLTNIRNGSADLWLAMDGQPSALTAQSGEGFLDIRVEGVACAGREIVPPSGRPVSRLVVSADPADGCSLRVHGQWADAQAFLGEAGVLVALDGVEVSPAGLVPVGPSAASGGSPASGEPAVGEDRSGEAGAQPGPATAPSPAGTPTGSGPGRPTALAGDGVCAGSASRLEDTPWDLNAMSAHADCLVREQRLADATTLYERVLAFEPGHYGAALGLARLRAAAGDREGAAELFQTAAEGARTDGEALAARQAAEELERR